MNDHQTILLRKNMVAAVVLKAIGMLTSFLIVPITLHYLNTETYGIWLTLSSILYWISFCDIGLGNGLRNYLSAVIVQQQWQSARQYIGTTLVVLFVIALFLGLLAVITLPFCDMQTIFHTTQASQGELLQSTMLAILMTLLLFVVKNIGLIYTALQLPAINDFLAVLGSILSLLTVHILTRTTEGDLRLVVAAYTVIPVLVFSIAAIPTFHHYPQLRPKWSDIDFESVKPIIVKGLGFFMIQITSCLVIFGGSNMFITQFVGPVAVTQYGLAYKWFYLLSIGYVTIITPYWNAYTAAQTQNNWEWIRRSFRNSMLIWGLTIIGGILMYFIAPWFIGMWIGHSVEVSPKLLAITLFYICAFNLNTGVTYLLNGLNIIRVQIWTSVVTTFLFLAIVIYLGQIGSMTSIKIVLLMGLSYLIMAAIHMYQAYLLLNHKATGIWNK